MAYRKPTKKLRPPTPRKTALPAHLAKELMPRAMEFSLLSMTCSVGQALACGCFDMPMWKGKLAARPTSQSPVATKKPRFLASFESAPRAGVNLIFEFSVGCGAVFVDIGLVPIRREADARCPLRVGLPTVPSVTACRPSHVRCGWHIRPGCGSCFRPTLCRLSRAPVPARPCSSPTPGHRVLWSL